MKAVPEIIDVLKDTLLQKLGDEVDLIFLYGSYLKGTTHRYSDVDISFVPVHDGAWYSITVMVDEKLFDLYPMHWPHLERMADFRDLSSSVLLENRVIYRRTEDSAARFEGLAERLRAQMQPEAKPQMLRLAQEIIQTAAYPYYLLRQEVSADRRLGCMQQVQVIYRTALHSLAVCNQTCVDTRKIAQVLALPKLPANFEETARRLTTAADPAALLAACDVLLQATRDLLVSEQRQLASQEKTYAEVFHSAYPELKRDIQAVLLGCERQNHLEIRGSLISLYQELSRGIALVETGVEYNAFNSLSEFEQDLAALGFPPLLPCLVAEDFEQLYQQCVKFDLRLQAFLSGHSVAMNNFADAEALRQYLNTL